MSKSSPFSTDALIASLRDMPSPAEVDPTIQQRLHARLAVSLFGLGPAATNLSEPRLDGAATSHASRIAPAASGIAAGSTKAAVLAWLAPVFVAGAMSGIAADRLYAARLAPTSAAAQRSITESPAPAASPATLPTAGATIVADANVDELARVPARAVATPPLSPQALASSEPASSMAVERQLLDSARTALARGEPQEGIASLEKHVKRFPKGTLAEEREALYVRILVATGNNVAASARAASFQRRFPNSIFMPVVERAMTSISRRIDDGESKP